MKKLIEDRILKYKNDIKEIRSTYKGKDTLFRLNAHIYEIQLIETSISELEWVLKNITYDL